MVLIDPECLDCSRPCCGKSFSPQEVREKVKLSTPKKRWLKEAKGYRNKQKELLSLYWTITVLGFLIGFLTFFFLSFGFFKRQVCQPFLYQGVMGAHREWK